MKRNCLYTVNPWNKNIFEGGGIFNKDSNSYIGNWLGGDKLSDGEGAALTALSGLVSTGAQKLIGSGYNSGVGNAVGNFGRAAGAALSNVNPALGAAVSVGSGIISGGVNLLGGTKVNQPLLDQVNANISNLFNYRSNASTFDDIKGPQSVATNFGKVFKGGLLKKGWEKEQNANLQNKLKEGILYADRSVDTNINNLQKDQLSGLLRGSYAFGGYFGMPQATGALGIMRDDKYIGAINNRSNAIAKANAFSQAPTSFSPLGNAFADGGGIHIKPSHKGLFTEKANRAGMGVQAYASHVLANKEDYPSSTVKQANFAKNAAGWKHDVGGSLEAAFLDNFSSDPLGAVMQYNRGLEAMAAQREAEEAAVAQQAAYDDMQKRMLAAETERQGLQSMLDSQGLTIQALMDAQRQNNYADDWKERVGMEGSLDTPLDSAVMSRMRHSLIDRGVTKRAVQDAVIANMMVESGGNPNAKNKNSSARGLMQWTTPRHPKAWDWDSQVDHIVNTLESGFGSKKAYDRFMNTNDSAEAARIFRQYWERPEKHTYNWTDKWINKMYGDKKAFGGELGTNGTDFTNGLLEINTGGNHEENPYEGVQLGLDHQGIPNLVEEGETVYNDYVYSKRMKVPEFMKKQLGLGGSTKDEITFADASKKIAEASKERPNNPMDQEYLADALGKLAQVQEAERMRMQAEEANAEMEAMNEMNMAACGGKLNKFDNGGKKINPYAYSESWDGFKYFDPSTQQYNADYMDFVNSINQDWINRIMSGQYGSMDRYLARNKGVTPSIAQVQALATDKKYSDMHKAMAAAYDDYLRGIDPVTGEVTLPEVVASNRSTDNYPQTYWGPGVDNTSFWTAAQQAGYTGLPEVDWRGNKGAKAPVYVDRDGNAKPVTTQTSNVASTNNINNVNANSDNPKKSTPFSRIFGVDEDDYYKTWMRYAPAIGSGIMTLTDLLGLTNKTDYTYADKVEAIANRLGFAPNIQYKLIGDYMTYRPLDRLFYANQLQANSRSIDRLAANMSGGNRGTAMASILANGYNTNNNLGNLYRQAEEYNLAQRERVADFNRKTNMFNSQMALEADSANARYRQMASHASLQGLAQAAAMRDAIDQRVGAARSANLTNLLNSLGNIGRENFALNQIRGSRAANNGYDTTASGKIRHNGKTVAFGGAIEKYQKDKKERR